MLNINYSSETITPETSFYDKYKGLLIINPNSLIQYEEIIRNDKNCRYPKLTLKILIHIFVETDNENKWNVNPGLIAEKLNAHYDTVTKCLKYLRSIRTKVAEK